MLKPTDLVKSVIQLFFWSAIAWLLYSVRAMIVYLIIAAVLTVLGKPLVRLMRQIQVGKFTLPLWACSLLTIVVFYGLASTIFSLLVPEFISEIRALSSIDFERVFSRFEGEFESVQAFLMDWQILPELTGTSMKDSLSQFLNITTIQHTFGTLVGGLGNVGIALFSITFILFFFLKEEELADSAIDNFVPEKWTKTVRSVIPKVKKTLSRYIFGLTIQLTAIFILVYSGLMIVGVKDAVIIALFAATMNVIPYIGPIIGTGFGLVLGLGQALSMDPGIDLLLYTTKLLGVFAVVQVLDNVVSQPLIYSNSINAHPLEIFIVISVAGTWAGIAGMVVAVPMYSILRIIAKESQVNVKFIQTLSKNA